MFARVTTVAFVGIEAKPVEVQVRISAGGARVRHRRAARQGRGGEPRARAQRAARRRPRPALKHITVNLAPADLPKEGSHFDLPIALAMMVAMGAISPDAIEGYAAIGELALDASIRAVPARCRRPSAPTPWARA